MTGPLSVTLQEAIVASDVNDRSARAQAVHRYEMELDRLQARLDVLCDDRLDGRVDVITYDKKAEEIRGNQQLVRTKITQCQPAGLAPTTKAVDLMSLTSQAAERFERQCASEQRRLLRLVLKEAIWQNGELRPCFREPFEQLRLSNAATIAKKGHFSANEGKSDIWRRKRDSNPRTSYPVNGFQDRRLQPLGHSSILIVTDFPTNLVGHSLSIQRHRSL
jgi:hypothetical protein